MDHNKSNKKHIYIQIPPKNWIASKDGFVCLSKRTASDNLTETVVSAGGLLMGLIGLQAC